MITMIMIHRAYFIISSFSFIHFVDSLAQNFSKLFSLLFEDKYLRSSADTTEMQ